MFKSYYFSSWNDGIGYCTENYWLWNGMKWTRISMKKICRWTSMRWEEDHSPAVPSGSGWQAGGGSQQSLQIPAWEAKQSSACSLPGLPVSAWSPGCQPLGPMLVLSWWARLCRVYLCTLHIPGLLLVHLNIASHLIGQNWIIVSPWSHRASQW